MNPPLREWDHSARKRAYDAAQAVMNANRGEPELSAARTLLDATGRLRWDRSEGEGNQLIGQGENGETRCRMRRAVAVEGQYRRAHRAVRWAREKNGCTATTNTVQWLGPVWVATRDDRLTNVTEIARIDEVANHVALAEGLWREDAKRAGTHDITVLGAYFASFARQIANGCAQDGRSTAVADAADMITVCICAWLHDGKDGAGPYRGISCIGDAPAVLNARECAYVSEVLARKGHGLRAMRTLEQELNRMDVARVMRALRGWGEEYTSIDGLLGTTWNEAGGQGAVAHQAVAKLNQRVRRLDG